MVWALAVTETISYGVLYSSFAAFLLPMQHSLGFGQTTLTGAFSAGVLVTGARAVPAGAWLDCCGARGLMTAGSLAAGARLAYRIRVTVEPPAEWTQMYHETWRLMRDNFWRAEWPGWTGPRCATATGRCWTASAPRMTCAMCCGSCRARWAARTPGCGRRARAVTRRWLRGCSAPISSAPRTGPGGSRGSCP